jgi:hypothetical protein
MRRRLLSPLAAMTAHNFIFATARTISGKTASTSTMTGAGDFGD